MKGPEDVPDAGEGVLGLRERDHGRDDQQHTEADQHPPHRAGREQGPSEEHADRRDRRTLELKHPKATASQKTPGRLRTAASPLD